MTHSEALPPDAQPTERVFGKARAWETAQWQYLVDEATGKVLNVVRRPVPAAPAWKVYELHWRETRGHTAFVQAASESAARQAWIDQAGEPFANEISWTEGSEWIDITELPGPHDPLCCCPSCETARSDLAVEEWRGTPWPPGNGDPGSVVE